MTDYIGLKLDSGRGRASQQARVVLVFCAARTCETVRCAQLPWYRGVSILAPRSFRNSLLSLARFGGPWAMPQQNEYVVSLRRLGREVEATRWRLCPIWPGKGMATGVTRLTRPPES